MGRRRSHDSGWKSAKPHLGKPVLTTTDPEATLSFTFDLPAGDYMVYACAQKILDHPTWCSFYRYRSRHASQRNHQSIASQSNNHLPAVAFQRAVGNGYRHATNWRNRYQDQT